MIKLIDIFIKKNFYESWDNFFKLFLLNLPVTLVFLPAFYFAFIFLPILPIALLITVISVYGFNVYFGVMSASVFVLMNNQQLTFKKYFSFFKTSLKPSVKLTLIDLIIIIIFFFVIPFYLKTGGFIGLISSSVIFWTVVLWIFASQYIWSLRLLFPDVKGSIFKKSIALFFDNKLFSLLLISVSAAYIAVSIFTAFLLPGLSFICFFRQTGIKMRLKKYDFLETLSASQKIGLTEIPWNEILVTERQDVDGRTLRGIIFPWKE